MMKNHNMLKISPVIVLDDGAHCVNSLHVGVRMLRIHVMKRVWLLWVTIWRSEIDANLKKMEKSQHTEKFAFKQNKQ